MPRKTVQEIIATEDVNQTRDWLTSASIGELTEFIHIAGRWTKHSIMTDFARAELSIRTAAASECVHWSVTPGFIVGVLAMLFAAIAAWPTVREWFQSVPPAHIDASSQSPPSNSVPVILPAPKTVSH